MQARPSWGIVWMKQLEWRLAPAVQGNNGCPAGVKAQKTVTDVNLQYYPEASFLEESFQNHSRFFTEMYKKNNISS